jgi:hypothetical protein
MWSTPGKTAVPFNRTTVGGVCWRLRSAMDIVQVVDRKPPQNVTVSKIKRGHLLSITFSRWTTCSQVCSRPRQHTGHHALELETRMGKHMFLICSLVFEPFGNTSKTP